MRILKYIFILSLILTVLLVLGFLKNVVESKIGIDIPISMKWVIPTLLTLLFTKLWYGRSHLNRFFLSRTIYLRKDIRISISYLFRIKINGKFLLIKSSRIQDSYQPVGGVYKRYDSMDSSISKYIQDDIYLEIDDRSEKDLRIRIKGKHLNKLIDWYESRKDREINEWREFYEELVATKIFDKKIFPYIHYKFLKSEYTPIKYSEHFNCYEMLIYEIFEFLPNEGQKEYLRVLLERSNDDRLLWAEENLIKQLGWDDVQKKQLYKIGEHTKNIL